jgi:precorrin-4/cobalt-precorrin-4 C11-methyltransferase
VTVHFVGAGPGAEDLLTLRAARLLAEADLVLYPGTYVDAVLTHCRSSASLVDTAELNLEGITALLVSGSREGKTVVRLTSGDPSLYSALTEQTRRLDVAGVPWDVVPGVPAYAAAAAVVGRELTVPLVAQSVVLTRTQARSTEMPATESLAAFAATRSTLVLHLAITKVRSLATSLVPEYGADCPAIVVYRTTQPDELVLSGTLADIADQVETADLRQAAVILVGWALAREGGESWLYTADRRRA